MADYPAPTRDAETGCLLWQGPCSQWGYPIIGTASSKAKTKPRNTNYVHRIVWAEANGPIPDGYEVDHVWERGCRHKHCIEPSHLEAVTHQENTRRAHAVMAAGRTHCSNGHAYVEGASFRWKTNHRGNLSRECKICMKAARERWNAKMASQGFRRRKDATGQRSYVKVPD